jgi:hypothetical protein
LEKFQRLTAEWTRKREDQFRDELEQLNG